jgi:cell shape-determining protein MreD
MRSRVWRTLLWSFVAMVAIGVVAIVTRRPFLFPSLGPSAIMLFADPLGGDSSPRHVLVGHFIGVGAATLIVSLRIMPQWSDYAIIMLAVAMLTLLAFAVNRISGVEYPAW